MSSLIDLYASNKSEFLNLLEQNIINHEKLGEQNSEGKTIIHIVTELKDSTTLASIFKFMNTMSYTERQNIINKTDNEGNTGFHKAIGNETMELMFDIAGASKKIPNNKNVIVDSPTTSSSFADSDEQVKCSNKDSIDNIIKKITSPYSDYKDSADEKPNVLLIMSDKKQSETMPSMLSYFYNTLARSSIIPNRMMNGGNTVSETSAILDINLMDAMTESESSTELFVNDMRRKVRDYQDGGAVAKKKKAPVAKKTTTKKKKAVVSESPESLSDIATETVQPQPSKEMPEKIDYHAKTIERIQDLGYSLEEAKVAKSGLYAYIKKEFPEYGNYKRSKKMYESANEEFLSKIDMLEVKHAIAEHFRLKNERKNSN
jgi:hypothetical protein